MKATYKPTKADTNAAREFLLQRLERGAKVYTIQRSTNRTGDVHWISAVIVTNGEAWNVSSYAAKALGRIWTNDPDLAVRCGGGGMDMHADLVLELASALYGDAHALTHGGRL
jgi:hypothetical protein